MPEVSNTLYLKQILTHITFFKKQPEIIRCNKDFWISPKPQFIKHFSVLAYLKFSHSLYRCVHNSSES